MGPKEWFACGVVIVAVMTGVIGFATPREDNRIIANSYNNQTNALVNVNTGKMGTTETTSVDNSQTSSTERTDSTVANEVTASGGSQVRLNEFGTRECWDEASKMWIQACPQPQ